jgi:hypothetical protein
MKEFMLLIRNEGEHTLSQSPEEHEEFLEKCSVYINSLNKEGKLIAAQPFVRQGVIISKVSDSWKEVPFDQHHEIQVGYYHILADDINEAIAIAKRNPEFEYVANAKIEVRPVKTKEASTGYIYPK